MNNPFNTKLLTADPKEHIRRSELLLGFENNSFLLYAALELRLALERIIHNQYTLSEEQKRGSKKKNDPKRKKLIMNMIDPSSDHDYEIYYVDPQTSEEIFWGVYKNISEKWVKEIDGKLGSLLHMKLGLNLGIETDPWYNKTREFLEETTEFLKERTTDSVSYFSYNDSESFLLKKK